MTARQRAMLERKTSDKDPSSSCEQLLALPSGLYFPPLTQIVLGVSDFDTPMDFYEQCV